ncbi:MAG: hypothetical protein FJX03_00695 [Alphaproteobacteria bacterium]|nr:hypothetical protein [Alphaproteobacteria bacterium]
MMMSLEPHLLFMIVKEIEKFIEPFELRFKRNSIDPGALCTGKKCLDAGGGNGRVSLFMATHGAKNFESIDISPFNV